jgi:uncharacterized protein YbbK (DUF523 family)
MRRIRIGVSACLLGEKVRYDGGDKRDLYVTETLGRIFEYVSVCPEVDYGLSVPREALRLVGDPASPRLIAIETGADHTGGMRRWAEMRLTGLDRENLLGFIFKTRSPSCGVKEVQVYDAQGRPAAAGSGLFAAAFIHRNPLIPVIDEEDLRDAVLGANFLHEVLRNRL